MKSSHLLALAAVAFVSGSVGWSLRAAADSQRVYELRTYTTFEGKLPDLQARFKNHTTKLFEKHGIHNVGYWVPAEEPLKNNTLVYMVSHQSMADAKKNWDAFRNDPQWKEVREKSELNGKIVEKVVSQYLDPTDYSPLK